MLIDYEELEIILSRATGQPNTKKDLLKVARNIMNMTRVFNLQEGLQVQDDRLRNWDEAGIPAKELTC